MRIRLLGPLDVLGDEEELLPLGGPKPRTLLALLALRARKPVSVDTLIDALWPDDPPKTAMKTLQTYVVHVRRAVGDSLVTRDGGYVLDLDPERVDVHEFETLVGAANQRVDQPAEALMALDSALKLWRGEPLPDLRFSPPLAAEATRLHEMRLQALALRAGALLDLDRHDEVLAEVSSLVEEHPLSERLWAHLMVALYRSGRHAEALRTFKRAREALAGVGLEPTPDLLRLEAAVLSHDPTLRAGGGGGAAKPAILAAANPDPFVGRQAEREKVEHAWRAVVDGERRVVLVTGEPGIGKTRLAAEVATWVAADEGLVLSGRCDQGALVPFQPFVEALRQHAPDATQESVERALALGGPALLRLVPELAPLARAASRVDDLEPDRATLFQSLVSLLGDAAARQPLMLVLDDLHWADDATLLLLRHVLRAPASRLAIVATFRQTEASDALAEHLALLRREVEVVAVPLEGLTEAEVAQFVRFAPPGGDDRLARLVHHATGGNPFFVEQVLHDLRVEGTNTQAEELPFPVAAREVIERRLSRLSPMTNRVLETAAIAGPEFDVTLLSAVVGSEDEVVASLEDAVGALLVAESPDVADRYRFSHALVGAALTKRLSASRQLRLHRDIADVLERFEEGAPGTQVSQVAHHLVEAGSSVDVDRVVRACAMAARWDLDRFAYEDAIRHFERARVAFERKGSPDPQERAELLLGLGRAQALAGRTVDSKSTVMEVAELARRLGSTRLLAQAAVGLATGRFGVTPDDDEELLLREALQALPPEEAELRIPLTTRLVQWLGMVSDDEFLLGITADSLRTARSTGNDELLLEALGGRAWVLNRPEHAEERLRIADELEQLARETSDPRPLLAAHAQRVLAAFALGDPKVRHHVAQHNEQAMAIRTVWPLQWKTCLETFILILDDRLDEAEANVGTLPDWDDQVLVRSTTELMQLVHVRRAQGRLPEIIDPLRPIVEGIPLKAGFQATLAMALAEAGRSEEAAHLVELAAGKGLRGVPRNRMWSQTVAGLAVAAAKTGHRRIARDLYSELSPYRGRHIAAGWEYHGAADDFLGHLALSLGRPEDAKAHLRDALVQYERLGALPWARRVRDALSDRAPAA